MGFHVNAAPRRPSMGFHVNAAPRRPGLGFHVNAAPRRPGLGFHVNAAPRRPGMGFHGVALSACCNNCARICEASRRSGWVRRRPISSAVKGWKSAGRCC